MMQSINLRIPLTFWQLILYVSSIDMQLAFSAFSKGS